VTGSPEPEDAAVNLGASDVHDLAEPGQSGGHNEQTSQAAVDQGAQVSNDTNAGPREDVVLDDLV
jgi:hypothetical protein